MAQFKIIESRPATYYWEYIIEAEDETEALNKILEGDIAAHESWVEESDGDESDFEISEVN